MEPIDLKQGPPIGVMHVILTPGGGAWSVVKELIHFQSGIMPTALGISLRKSVSDQALAEARLLNTELFTYNLPLEFPNASALLLPPLERWLLALQRKYPGHQWVTHFHNGGGIGFAFWPGIFPFTAYRHPSVNTFHGIPPEDIRPELRGKFGIVQTKISAFLSRQMAKRGVKIATLSEVSKEEIAQCYQVPPRDISIVHNGVRACAGNAPREDGVFRVGFVGSLTRKKRWDIVKDAVLLLNEKRRPPVRLVIAGWGPEEGSVREVAQAHPESIEFIGEVKEAGQTLIPTLDALVLPSLHEGQPMVILEALASGVPVIASKVGAIPETIVDGESGFLLDKASPENVAQALRQLIENPEKRRQMSIKARQSWEDKFSAAKMAGGYCQLYLEALTQFSPKL